MLPWFLHFGILMILTIVGLTIYIMETLSPAAPGGLFLKYDATTLYWLGFLGYSAISTSVVLSVFIALKFTKYQFTTKVVILSHILPIGLVWISLQLGIHDFIQNTWKSKVAMPVEGAQQQKHTHSRNRLKTLPPTPIKNFKYKSSNGPVEIHSQEGKLIPHANSSINE